MKKIGRQFGTSLLAYDGGYPATGTALPKPAGDSQTVVADKIFGFPLFNPPKGTARPAPLDAWNWASK